MWESFFAPDNCKQNFIFWCLTGVQIFSNLFTTSQILNYCRADFGFLQKKSTFWVILNAEKKGLNLIILFTSWFFKKVIMDWRYFFKVPFCGVLYHPITWLRRIKCFAENFKFKGNPCNTSLNKFSQNYACRLP